MTDRLEAGLVWHRGKSRCEGGACAEVARKGDVILLRSTLNPDVRVAFRHDEWKELLIAMKERDFDKL